MVALLPERTCPEVGWRERPCKPDPVLPCGRGGHFSGTGLASGLERSTRKEQCAGRRGPSLFGLSPSGVCLASPVTRTAVRSYRTVSPLPAEPRIRRCEPRVGGLFSVALSLASRPVAVGNHPDPRSPDFPPREVPSGDPVQRPPGPLTPPAFYGRCAQSARRSRLAAPRSGPYAASAGASCGPRGA